MKLFYTQDSFVTAAGQGNIPLLEKHVKNFLFKKDWLNGRDKRGWTALTLAAHEGKPETIRFLLEQGANIHTIDAWGQSPLSRAIGGNNEVSTKVLLNAGATPSESLLESAVVRNREVIAGLLLAANVEAKGMNGYLFHAAKTGSLAMVRTLVKAGADINGSNKSGLTPLMGAARTEQEIAVRYLLEEGADAGKKSPDGETALDISRKTKNTVLIGVLCRHLGLDEGEEKEDLNWTRIDAACIARVAEYTPIQHKITEIFNFESRERLLIIKNTEMKSEISPPPQNFDILEEAYLRKAFTLFKKLGGTADEEFVFKRKFLKKDAMPVSYP